MKKILAVVGFVAVSSLANASTTVFADNFDANAGGTNLVPSGWTVTNGTVDIIGQGTSWNYIPNSGKFIDLDGSSSDAGVLSKSFDLVSGNVYTAYFDLAGSHARDVSESVTVNFGGVVNTYSLQRNDGWTNYFLSLSPVTSGSYALSFSNAGGDNVGMLLDNVRIIAAPVPEPETYAMLLAGLGLMGGIARRRSQGK